MMLTNYIADIQPKVNQVLNYSQNLDGNIVANTDRVFDNWAKNKQSFFRAFENKLIWEYPEEVCIQLDDKKKEEKISNFLTYILFSGYENGDALCDFIKANKETFFDNFVAKKYIYKDIEIPHGMKIIKAFKYFISNDKEKLNDIQNYASRIVQENKITGTLCFSIHPLDYLSLSENTYNWRSCHALDGEYRLGNISYMQDKTTIVCYIRGEKEAQLSNFPENLLWNSKKWRMLLFTSYDNSIIFAGRQYPFESKKIMSQIREFCINTLMEPAWGDVWASYSYSEWSNSYIDCFQHKDINGVNTNYYVDNKFLIGENGNLIKLSDLVTDNYNTYHYNDLLHSSCYTPYYMFVQRFGVKAGTSEIVIGEPTYCISCGGDVDERSDTMLCCNCEYNLYNSNNYYYCDCCNFRFDIADLHRIGDMYICENCFDTYVKTCPVCGIEYYVDDFIYDKENNTMICNNCWDEKYNKYE